jgi:GntR family transcriptional regulator
MGHFVANPDEVDMQCIRSFTEDAYRAGRKPATRVLSIGQLSADSNVAHELGVSQGDTVARVRRLRLLDEKPTFFSDAYLPVKYGQILGSETLKEDGIEQSLFHALKQIPELRLMQGSESTVAVSADTEMAKAFSVSEGSPLVQRVCTLMSQSGEPIVFEQATWGVPITRNIQAMAPNTFGEDLLVGWGTNITPPARLNP